MKLIKLSILILWFAYSNVYATESRFSYQPEWSLQEAVWIGWPANIPDPSEEEQSFYRAQANVRVQLIKEMSSGSKVNILVTSDKTRDEVIIALEKAGIDIERINFFIAPIEDGFVRDAGPRFASNGKILKVLDIPWKCYGWDSSIADPEYLTICKQRDGNDNAIAKELGLEMLIAKASSEGGALEATSILLMGYLDTALQRNPGMTKEEIEIDYLEIYGKQKMIWLRNSPVTDRAGHKTANYFGWGASGHIDEYARFVNEHTVVFAMPDESKLDNALAKAEYSTLLENLAELEEASDVNGQKLNIVKMPAADPALFGYQAPLGLPHIPTGWQTVDGFSPSDFVNHVPAVSYLNFVITNDKIIVAKYWTEGYPESIKEDDDKAKTTLQSLFPKREVVQINPLMINWMGGGMHCLTQQQPAVMPELSSQRD